MDTLRSLPIPWSSHCGWPVSPVNGRAMLTCSQLGMHSETEGTGTATDGSVRKARWQCLLGTTKQSPEDAAAPRGAHGQLGHPEGAHSWAHAVYGNAAVQLAPGSHTPVPTRSMGVGCHQCLSLPVRSLRVTSVTGGDRQLRASGIFIRQALCHPFTISLHFTLTAILSEGCSHEEMKA